MTGNLFANPDPSATEGWFTAHCDGGSRGNPGPSGYGAVIEDPQGRVAARLSQFLGIQTNNYAEYSGLLAVDRTGTIRAITRSLSRSSTVFPARSQLFRRLVSRS